MSYFNPQSGALSSFTGRFLGIGSRYVRLAGCDIPVSLVVVVEGQEAESLHVKDSPQESTLGRVMQKPERVRVKYWKGDALASVEGTLLNSDPRFVRVAVENGEMLIGAMWAVEVQKLAG